MTKDWSTVLNRVVAFLALFVGLAAYPSAGYAGLMDKIMNSWMGATIDEAIGQWGLPDEERKIAGKQIYVWRDDAGGLGDLINCERMLAVNAKGVVVAVDHKGNNCPFLPIGPYAKWKRR